MGESVLTAGFQRVDDALYCEGVAVERIAHEVGTPVYIYSAATIRDRYEKVDEMFPDESVERAAIVWAPLA